MKNLLLALPFISLFASCTGPVDEISVANQTPDAVTKAFIAKYPGATNVEWNKGVNEWDAEFTLNSEKKSAIFTVNGNFIKEEVGANSGNNK